MGSRHDVAGLNTRFGDKRFKGFHGAQGFNIYPREGEEAWVATDPAATYTTIQSFLADTIVANIQINVTEVFDGAATIIVGVGADPDQFVELADAVDLTTTGIKNVAVPTTRQVVAAAGPFVTTIGGAPTQGSCIVTADFEE